MIDTGIVIHWESADEYIKVDFDDLEVLKEVRTTLEWWRNAEKFVCYNTHSSVKKLRDGTKELTLIYNQQENLHIDPDDACWGLSTIRELESRAVNGTAKWEDFNNKKYNGVVGWERVTGGLIKKSRKRNLTSAFQREQAKFRSALLASDRERCVLTGEKTLDALEAAHIISVKDGGNEVLENGILLRADLHRLYDAGKFLIDPSSGKIVKIKDLSQSYRRLLSFACVAPQILNRVQPALDHQWCHVSGTTKARKSP